MFWNKRLSYGYCCNDILKVRVIMQTFVDIELHEISEIAQGNKCTIKY